MGLAELLGGKQNPFAQWAGENRNLLGAMGAGLARGPNLTQGFAEAADAVPAARTADAAALTQERTEQQAEVQLNATSKFLAASYPDLAAALAAGAPMERIWGEALERLKSKAARLPPPAVPPGA